MHLSIGMENDTIRSIQEIFHFLGFRVGNEKKRGMDFLPVTGKFDADTLTVVLDFQESEGLLRDGIVGSVTMEALERQYHARIHELNLPGIASVDGMPDRLVLEGVSVDSYQGSPERIFLRTDAAADLRKVFSIVKESGGSLPVSAGLRSLQTPGSPSRSALSFHYAGLALDLFYFGGLFDPSRDPYVIQREAENTYRVFVRCDKKGKGGRTVDSVASVISLTDRKRGKSVKGRFLDLTTLFSEHGFFPIKARPLFEAGESFMGAEWWHFQYEKSLTSRYSQFGRELSRVYNEDTLRNSIPWKYRNHIFKVNWF